MLFTWDLQLYKVTLDVKWAYPDRFSNVIPRLGGMHSLMSFVGCIGTLMENSGLSDILSPQFSHIFRRDPFFAIRCQTLFKWKLAPLHLYKYERHCSSRS